MVRLYGQFQEDNHGSQAVVAKGFASVFAGANLCELEGLGNDLDDVKAEQPGASDKVGIFLGPLSYLSRALHARHEELWVMVAPNSDTIGREIPEALRGAPHVRVMAPSRWAEGVLRKALPGACVMCVPHGVGPEFFPRRAPVTSNFEVLHVSSSALQRKGTEELIRAWGHVRRADWRLFVSVPDTQLWHFRTMVEELKLNQYVLVAGRLNYSPDRMAALYSRMDYVCQPSRGEGFGMVPLEARACGTPAIMTACTGHSQHVTGPGVCVVPTGDLEPIDDFPGALAPSLSVVDLALTLERAYSERAAKRTEAQDHVSALREAWSWYRQLQSFHKYITDKEVT